MGGVVFVGLWKFVPSVDYLGRFWIVSAFVIFAFMMVNCNGILRLYLVFGALVGELCYYFSVGKFTGMMFRFVRKCSEKIFLWLEKHLFSHVKCLYLRLKISFKKSLQIFFSYFRKKACKKG